jgi:FkbM family methyltransferase
MSRSLWVRSGVKFNAVLSRFGLRLSRFPAAADRRRARLLESHQISTVVDIGANTGQYASLLRRFGYGGRILSFEPDPEAFGVLQKNATNDPRWEVHQKAVGAGSGDAVLRVAENSVSSSLLNVDDRHLRAEPASRVVKSVVVPSISLDEIVAELGGEALMVKIDTQGYENQVLASGATTLGAISLLELEMSLVELYAGQWLFRQLDSYVCAAGFRLLSMEEGFFDETTGELLQFDSIYGRIR